MKKLLAQNNHPRLITADIKAKGPKHPKGEPFSDKSNQITTGITSFKSPEETIEKLPMAIITLATILPKEEIRRLGQWFRQNVDPQALLEIRQDPKILGGCQIIWRGLEGDFSLRKKFQPSFAIPLRSFGASEGQAATEGKENG